MLRGIIRNSDISVELIDYRNLDMIMLSCFNGAERSKREFKDLLRLADPRLMITNFIRPQGSAMSIIEVALKG